AAENAREGDPQAGEAQHGERQEDPEADEMMDVGVGRILPLPAEAAAEGAADRPPQPDPGEAGDEHEDADPADDRAAPAGDHEITVEIVEDAHEAAVRAGGVEHLAGAGIEPDVQPLRRAFTAPGLGEAGDDRALAGFRV